MAWAIILTRSNNVRSLALKLVLAFLLVSLVGTVLAGGYIWWTTTDEFSRFVTVQNRFDIAQRLANEYAARGSWPSPEEWSRIDPFAPLPEPPATAAPAEAKFASRSHMVIVDLERRVVLSGRGYHEGDIVPEEEYSYGVPIVVDGKEVGRLLLDSEALSPKQPSDRFFSNFFQALRLGAVGGTVVALALGIILTRSLTAPLRELTRATRAMSKGKLAQRIPVRSRDELGELASSFNQLSSDLVDAQGLRRQMTADIAHELRTPLSLILGHAEGLADGVLPATRETFDIIYDEARHLTKLVDDLRTLSLSDAGELSLYQEPVPPHALLQSVVAAHSHDAAERQIELKLVAAEDLPEVLADPDRVTQVLHNLLSNALRHTPAGGSIALSAEAREGFVEFAVADTGSGLPPGDLARVFERLYKGDSSRQRDSNGSGLGLSIARSLVEAHGGRIWAESVLGQGATFRFTLPLA